jgi:hypothetical protein
MHRMSEDGKQTRAHDLKVLWVARRFEYTLSRRCVWFQPYLCRPRPPSWAPSFQQLKQHRRPPRSRFHGEVHTYARPAVNEAGYHDPNRLGCSSTLHPQNFTSKINKISLGFDRLRHGMRAARLVPPRYRDANFVGRTYCPTSMT